MAEDHMHSETADSLPRLTQSCWALLGINGCVVMLKKRAIRQQKAS